MNIVSRLREALSPQQRRVIGEEAKQLLQNKHFREAFDSVESYLIDQAKGCNPNDKELTQRVVIAMQLHEALKREIVRKVEDGEMAQIEITELEKRGAVRRFIR